MDSLGTSPTKRRSLDIMKLMMSDYEVDMAREDGSDFDVIFHGPKDTAYQGGVWKVHVALPAEYPYRSPSIGFRNCIYHPNVDETSGSVCLDVINQTWSPMFDLVNIFDVFLPQLLAYPNPTDPLNNEAAALLIKNPEEYAVKVKQYVSEHAIEELKAKEENINADSPGSTTSTNQSTNFSTDVSCEENDELSSMSDTSEGGFDLDI